MITWMQRRRKYLVPTIWVSVIAFVGAGFVGWGAYDFGADRGSAVAKVEDRKITVQEFQLAYANHFNFYNNMLGGKLTQEKADQMDLEKIVLTSVINEAIVLAYADEIGLRASEAEIKNALASDPTFFKDGVFDLDTYFMVLRQSQIKPRDYESGLERQVLLEKINAIMKLNPTPIEKELFTAAMFMQNRLAVDVITLGDKKVTVNEEDIKEFWEENKANYLTEKSFDLDFITFEPLIEEIIEEDLKSFYQQMRHNYRSSEGKILSLAEARDDVIRDYRMKLSKREALKTYLQFKKNQIEPAGVKNIKISDTSFPIEELDGVKVGQTLKPIEKEDKYLIVRLKSINFPTPKPYIDARATILAKLQVQKQLEALQQKAKARLEVFRGKDIGFVNREGTDNIDELTQAESLEFINYVFDNNRARGFKIIADKAILYQILEQKLLDDEKLERYASLVHDTVAQMKQAQISQNLVTNLRRRYSIEQYYKGN